MNHFDQYPDAKFSVIMSDLVVMDTLERCLAYGGHDTYIVSPRTVLFTTWDGFEQFTFAFEDLFEQFGYMPSRLTASEHEKFDAFCRRRSGWGDE